MAIDSYSFGRIVVNGTEHTSDIIIYPDGRVQDSWWRRSGHCLSQADIGDLVASGPELIIAGTGASGLMKPDSGLADSLEQEGIEFMALPCSEAAALYNELSRSRRVGACFHLTC
jgi:hypothetical protein